MMSRQVQTQAAGYGGSSGASVQVPAKKKAAKKKAQVKKKAGVKAKGSTGKAIGKRIDAKGEEKVIVVSETNALAISDNPELEEHIQKAMTTIDKLIGQRKIINAKVKAVYDDLEAQGIHRDEVKLVVKLAACDEQQRKFRDQSRRIIRKALDVPDETEKQMTMFEGSSTVN